MSKPVQEQQLAAGPGVLRFKARLATHSEKARTADRVFLDLPPAVAAQFTHHGETTVEGTINGQPFRAALVAGPSGGQRLPVNKAMLQGAGAAAGDTVELAILAPEPEPAAPADLRGPLAASAQASRLWQELTTAGRRDWIRWIEMAKKPETRARRVTRTVEQLAEGKRRPCCVDFYEYMLLQVNEAAPNSDESAPAMK